MSYSESEPIKLPKSIFRLHQHIIIDLNKSPGIGIDDGCPEFMFVKENDVRLKFHGRDPVTVPRAFSVGKIKGPFKIQSSGRINFFGLKLQPWVGGHFFPSNAVNDVIDLTRVYGPGVESLRSEIFASTSFEMMVELAEAFFCKLEMPRPGSFTLAMEICEKIYISKGMISVKELVKEFSRPRQKINKDFLRHTKYSIKEFADFVKARETIKFMKEHPGISLTELAYRFGYFDQSHFNRHIKRVTNVTPTFLFSHQNFIKEQLKESDP